MCKYLLYESTLANFHVLYLAFTLFTDWFVCAKVNISKNSWYFHLFMQMTIAVFFTILLHSMADACAPWCVYRLWNIICSLVFGFYLLLDLGLFPCFWLPMFTIESISLSLFLSFDISLFCCYANASHRAAESIRILIECIDILMTKSIILVLKPLMLHSWSEWSLVTPCTGGYFCCLLFICMTVSIVSSRLAEQFWWEILSEIGRELLTRTQKKNRQTQLICCITWWLVGVCACCHLFTLSCMLYVAKYFCSMIGHWPLNQCETT